MFSTTTAPPSLWRFSLVTRSFLTQPGLPFAAALSEECIEQAFGDEGPDDSEQNPETRTSSTRGR